MLLCLSSMLPHKCVQFYSLKMRLTPTDTFQQQLTHAEEHVIDSQEAMQMMDLSHDAARLAVMRLDLS